MDSAFKEQAKLLKSQEKRQSRGKRERMEQATSTESHSRPNGQSMGEDIPDLLPEEVLEDFSFHEPSPEPAERSKKKPGAQRKNQTKSNAERSKDLRVGPVSVSVLKKESDLLAPKANFKSLKAKRRWLLGRRGREGPVIQRRKAVRSFLRT